MGEPRARRVASSLTRVLRRALEPSSRDAGGTLVEVIVSVALLVIILLPTTFFVIESQRTASGVHLRAEAVNIATRALETAEANADAGQLPTGNQTSTVKIAEFGSRETTFTEVTNYTTTVQGTSATVCQAAAGVSSQIWQVVATVTWNRMAGAAPVIETLEIAPGIAGASQQFSGELAVALDLASGSVFTGTPTLTLSGQWEGAGSAPSVPAGQVTSRSLTSTGDGCVVFQDMDADSGWDYTLSLAGNPTLVSSDEHSDANPNGPLSSPPILLSAGVLKSMVVTVDDGTLFSIGYTGPAGDCSVGPLLVSPAATPSELPISVENGNLPAVEYANNTWVAYKSGGPPIPSLLLFPWSGLTYMWAGDQQYSNPTEYGGSNVPCSVDDTSLAPTAVFLPLYPLYLSVSGSGTGLAAQEVSGGGYSFSLNQPAGSSSTSLPLGEYLLTDSSGSVTSGGSPAYVWVEPSGDCLDTSVDTPPAASSCNSGAGSPLAVSAS